MLSRENRLNRSKDFEKAFKKGLSCFSENIIVKALKNELDISRIGFSVGVKVSKKAIERNRIKRVLRESVRIYISQMKKGFDIVIIYKKTGDLNKFDSSEAKKQVKEVFEKSNLLKSLN